MLGSASADLLGQFDLFWFYSTDSEGRQGREVQGIGCAPMLIEMSGPDHVSDDRVHGIPDSALPERYEMFENLSASSFQQTISYLIGYATEWIEIRHQHNSAFPGP